MENNKIDKTKLINELLKRNTLLVTINDLRKIIGKSRNVIYQIVFQLKNKSWIKEIEKGKYLVTGFETDEKFHPFFIATQIAKPSYVSFWSALQYYGLTEQLPKIVYTVTTRSKKPLNLERFRIEFIKFNSKRFFGYKREIIDGQEIFVAEKEKCIVDCLYQLRYSGGITEVSKAISNSKNEIDLEKLLNYALKMGSKTLLKRLGYLLEINGIDASDKIPVKGYPVVLDPNLPKKGKTSKKWSLIINRKRWDE